MESLHSKRYREFAKKLKLARVEAELTQDAVAEAIGKPQSFISDCERRQRRFDFIELVDLARLYGKPLAYFLPRVDADMK